MGVEPTDFQLKKETLFSVIFLEKKTVFQHWHGSGQVWKKSTLFNQLSGPGAKLGLAACRSGMANTYVPCITSATALVE